MMIPVEKWTHELDALFIANQVQLRRAAYKILGDWERSEDVVQDAYIKISEMPATQKVRQPLAYLFRIVRNLAIGTDEEGLHIPALTGTPETTAINRQHLDLVVEALAKLPERTKRVFELYRVEGYTHRMIADELDISTSLANILIREATSQCRNVF